MFCGNGIGIISTQTNWISQPICNARHARGARRRRRAEWQKKNKKNSVAWRQVRWSSRARSVSTDGREGEAACGVCDWWVSDEVLSAAGQFGSESICQIWLQPCWVWGERKRQITGSIAGWESGGRVVCGGEEKKMMKRRCDQCFRTLRLLPSLSEPPPFVPGLFPPPPSHRSSSALITVTGLSLNLSLFWQVCWPFFFLSACCSPAHESPNWRYRARKKKKRKCQYRSSSRCERGSPFFSLPEIKLTRLWSGLHLKKI